MDDGRTKQSRMPMLDSGAQEDRIRSSVEDSADSSVGRRHARQGDLGRNACLGYYRPNLTRADN